MRPLRGRLIGPKPWDRIDINFWKPKCLACNCEGCLGVLIHKFCIKSCIDCNEAGNGRKNGKLFQFLHKKNDKNFTVKIFFEWNEVQRLQGGYWKMRKKNEVKKFSKIFIVCNPKKKKRIK